MRLLRRQGTWKGPAIGKYKMDSITYYYWTAAIAFVYFAFLIAQGRFRLVLPSVVHTFIWMVTSLLVVFQLKGVLVITHLSNDAVNIVSKFTCYIVIASVIGFSFAHYITERYESFVKTRIINLNVVEELLQRFKWIPYMCGIVGVTLFIFLVSTIGNTDLLDNYRLLAIQTERVGYAAIAQRISGHLNILGGFYLMLLGYKSGQRGIKIKEFLLFTILCSAINISIGGRVWILTSILPFFTTYALSRYCNSHNKTKVRNDNKWILVIFTVFISLFSIIGMLRNSKSDGEFMDKFLYLTDGTRMTNMVLKQFPETTFPYEYGMSTLLGGVVQSPMATRFVNSISHDIGLSVTVKSTMPYLYYDFGFVGGAIFWGFICFFIELFCIRLKYSASIIGLFLFGTLSTILFETPVGHIFSTNTPRFEWILLFFIFRKYIFGNTSDID
jgi:oligosaccharide repeat unit polymerase